MKPFIFPVHKGYTYWISQRFGENKANYPNGKHIGVDIAVVTGTPLLAVADYEIVLASDIGSPYGVEIRYLTGANNEYLHTTAHLLKCLVVTGQKGKQGDVIALSDNTGMSTGPHNHHDIRMVKEITGAPESGPQMAIAGRTFLVPDYNNGTYGCFDYSNLMEGLEGDVFPVDLRYGQGYSVLREASWAISYNETLVKQQALAAGFGMAELPRLKNAFVYGYWDKQFVFDTANYQVWREMTRPEFLKRLGKL